MLEQVSRLWFFLIKVQNKNYRLSQLHHFQLIDLISVGMCIFSGLKLILMNENQDNFGYHQDFFLRFVFTDNGIPIGVILELKSITCGLEFFMEFLPPCITGTCLIMEDFVRILTVPNRIRRFSMFW